MFVSILAVCGIALNVWGYAVQERMIREKKSGKSVSLTWFISLAAASLVTILYGTDQKDHVFTLNAIVCGLGQIYIIRELWKYKGFRWWEGLLSILLLAMIVAEKATPYKGLFVILVSLANGLYSLAQPLELYDEKETGALHRGTLIAFGISGIIWTFYSWEKHYWSLALCYGAFVLHQAFIIGQWYYYHNRKPT